MAIDVLRYAPGIAYLTSPLLDGLWDGVKWKLHFEGVSVVRVMAGYNEGFLNGSISGTA